MLSAIRASLVVIAAVSLATSFGCANYEVNTKRGNIPGYYIRYELQEADRAVEAARAAGKDKGCPEQFKAAEDAKDHAYDVFRSCRTEEGAALAKQATAKANALCPPQPKKVAEPVPVPPPAPVPVPPPAPVPAPVPVAPSAKLSAVPNPITKGASATLAWSSQNASRCSIEPGIGAVPAEGSMSVAPSDNTQYTLACFGEGGEARSAANIMVIVPPPVVVAPARKLCSPTVIDIQFDTNKSDVKPQFRDELKKVGDFLVEFPNAKGTIEGHTDSVGNLADNMKLSQRRADSVRNYLITTFGIAPERIKAKGYGPTKPVADNKTKEGKAQNRRTEANFTCD
jgi:OOP family OmpA-OmpF porin